LPAWRQRLRRQRRAQVRAADPDVDYVGEFAAAAAGDRAVAHAVGEFAHASERGLDLRHDIHAVDHHWHRVAQRRVQHCAILAYVDFFAVEQALDFVAEAALARERDEQLHRFGADQVFGIIEQHVARPQREILEALRVGREQLSQVRTREIVAMRFKREPRAG